MTSWACRKQLEAHKKMMRSILFKPPEKRKCMCILPGCAGRSVHSFMLRGSVAMTFIKKYQVRLHHDSKYTADSVVGACKAYKPTGSEWPVAHIHQPQPGLIGVVLMLLSMNSARRAAATWSDTTHWELSNNISGRNWSNQNEVYWKNFSFGVAGHTIPALDLSKESENQWYHRW